MNRALTDDTLRAVMVQRGLEQVKKFNWYRVARNTLAVYYEVHASDQKTSRSIPFELWKTLKKLEKQQTLKPATGG